MGTVVRPPSVPVGIWSAASALDSKVSEGPVEPRDRSTYFGIQESWAQLSKREQLLARGGQIQVPYLIDPNTGAALYESRAILEYLDRTYAA